MWNRSSDQSRMIMNIESEQMCFTVVDHSLNEDTG